jgi:hypothetical protein
MSYLNWIDDKQLQEAVKHLLLKANEAQHKAQKDFTKNVIDPFSTLFEMAGFDIEYNAWLESEKTRQAQKTLLNHVGEFHQNILGCVKGWTNLTKGNVVDILSEKKKVIGEIKNKYNTISGGKLAELYSSLEKLVMPKASVYKGYTAYYVAIVPKKPQRFNREFTPSDKEKGEKCALNEKIREIDGASFYALVTGDENALENLFDVLPTVIKAVSKNTKQLPEKQKLKEFFKKAFE